MAARSEPSATADREIVVSRDLDAPRELVFAAWTDPRHVSNWWGPRGFTTTTKEMDVRPGGVWRFVMHGPDGTDYKNKIAFLEVARPERIAYKHAGEEDTENVRFQTTVTFEDQGGKTRLTLLMVFASAEERNHVVEKYGAIEGGQQTLERLAEHLAGEFVVTRTFDAPRELVFKAWTEKERLMRWWGPKGFTLLSCTIDARPGGTFHYALRAPDGGEMWGKWGFREVAPPERLVFVASFADAAGNVIRAPFSKDWPLEVLSTVTFTEHDGRTTLVMRGVPLSASEAERKAFDAMHGSMQQGWGGTLDQLTAELALHRD
jgi:uncharacterized protein YndB with AHSA1/START domain